MNKEFIEAICALEKEKDISKDILIEAIESALVSAYKKNYGTSQNVRVNIDRELGDIDVFMRKDVVAEDQIAHIGMALTEVLQIHIEVLAAAIIAAGLVAGVGNGT